MARKKKEEGEVTEKEPKAPGVINRLVYHLQNGGGTVADLASKLREDFPDRANTDPEKGVSTTVRVQLGKKDGRIAKLGLIKTKPTEGDDKHMVYSLPPAA